MARSKKKSASKVAVAAPASSPLKPLKNRKREAKVVPASSLVKPSKNRKREAEVVPASSPVKPSKNRKRGAEVVPASSPVKPLKNRKREAEVVVENESVRAKKRKVRKNGKPVSESHSARSGVEAVAVAAPPHPSTGRSEEEQSTGFGGSKTLVFKNISYEAQKADILEFFKSAGEVVDVRLALAGGDSFKGYGHVDFATAEEAQKVLLELNGKKLLERPVRLFLHREEEKVVSRKLIDGSKTLIFKNISYEAQKADVLNFFKSAGEVVDVRLALNEDDSFKGSGHVEFATTEEAQRALVELNTKRLLQRPVVLFPGKEEKKVESGKTLDGSKTLIFKNLPYEAQKADVLKFFKSAAEVVDVRLATNEDGSFKGRGNVVFATTEEAQKALLELNGKKLLQRSVFLCPGREEKKVECGKTLLIKNLSFQVQKADVLEFFKPAGEVVDVRLAVREGDSFKYSAHVDFATAEQAEKALLELKGKKFMRRTVKLTRKEEKEGEESTGGKTLVVHNVFHKVSKEAVSKFFKPAGEVVDVRLATEEGDSFKGYGHVDFATAEQAEKALQELNGKKLLQRAVKIERVSIPSGPHGKPKGTAKVQNQKDTHGKPKGTAKVQNQKDTPETGANTMTVGDN